MYEHPRYHSRYYTLDDKEFYLGDLKREAFDNIKDRYIDNRYPLVKKEMAWQYNSLDSMLKLIHAYRYDVFKSCMLNFSYDEFLPAWRERDMTMTLFVSNQPVSIRHWPGPVYGSASETVDIELNVLAWGFLESIRNSRQPNVHTSILYNSIAGTELEMSFRDDTMLVTSSHPGILAWAKQIIGVIENYKTLNGTDKNTVKGTMTPPAQDYTATEIKDIYGKVRIYEKNERS
jgi:hypothetical protein